MMGCTILVDIAPHLLLYTAALLNEYAYLALHSKSVFKIHG